MTPTTHTQAVEARREIGKWLNEEQTAPIDRVALAQLCAGFDALARQQEAPVGGDLNWRKLVEWWESGAEDWEALKAIILETYIAASRVPVASPAEPVAPVSFVVRHADRSVRDTSMSVGDSVAEPDSVHPDSGECGGVQKPGPTDADLLKLYKGDDYGDTHQFALLDFAHAVIASSKGGDQGEGK